jgi:hypothetical protein
LCKILIDDECTVRDSWQMNLHRFILRILYITLATPRALSDLSPE